SFGGRKANEIKRRSRPHQPKCAHRPQTQASGCFMATRFCDAYASWQKGAVENANGRLRRDLPRDLDLDALSDAELQEIVLSHNLTPRKCLGFLTPLQALLKELGEAPAARKMPPSDTCNYPHLSLSDQCFAGYPRGRVLPCSAV